MRQDLSLRLEQFKKQYVADEAVRSRIAEPPVKFIGDEIMELAAAALLQGSSLPITQVAEQCGFGTIRSFNRVFLKEKGMTPSAFRKQNVL